MTFRRYVFATHGPTLESRFRYRLTRAASIDKGKEFVVAEAALFIGVGRAGAGPRKVRQERCLRSTHLTAAGSNGIDAQSTVPPARVDSHTMTAPPISAPSQRPADSAVQGRLHGRRVIRQTMIEVSERSAHALRRCRYVTAGRRGRAPPGIDHRHDQHDMTGRTVPISRSGAGSRWCVGDVV